MSAKERQLLGDRIRAARDELEGAIAYAELQARNDYAAGDVTEVQMAADFQVNRLTIRRWLGK